MGATTVNLTVRSINNTVLTTSLNATFVVDRMGLIIANQNTLTTATVTEAGDTANQLSVWELYGSAGQTLGWELVQVAGDNTVTLFTNTNHDVVVATGTRTGNGILKMYPVGDYNVSGSVTIAYSADDIDAANTVTVANYVATKDLQLPGNTQFEYLKDDGQVIKYTVDETTTAINTAINGASAIMESTTTLTLAQITTLFTVPVTAIATPGVGYVIEVLSAFVNYTWGVDDITGNLTMDIMYTTGAVEIGTCTNAFSGGTPGKITKMLATAGVLVSNSAILLKMDTGDPTMGGTETGTAIVKITYKITAL